MEYKVVQLSEDINGFELLKQYNKRIGCSLADDELQEWLDKIITKGVPLGIIVNGEIIAFLLLYCNNTETLEAYICNVYVDDTYRGKKLSMRLVEESINICKDRRFKCINLDVSETNIPARKVYEYCGFIESNKYLKDSEKYLRMTYYL